MIKTDKWKKEILKAIYKQWIKTNGVSAQDIIKWLQSPENNFELYSGVLGCLYESWYYKYYIGTIFKLRKLFGLENEVDNH